MSYKILDDNGQVDEINDHELIKIFTYFYENDITSVVDIDSFRDYLKAGNRYKFGSGHVIYFDNDDEYTNWGWPDVPDFWSLDSDEDEDVPKLMPPVPQCQHKRKYVNMAGGTKFYVCPDCKSDLGDVK